MRVELKTWGYDMLTAIHEIEVFLDDVPSFESYKADLKTKRAVERNLEIIGEAVTRMSKLVDRLPITNSKQIIGTRNKIIHGYDVVSDELIWSIITQSLPTLKLDVERMLEE